MHCGAERSLVFTIIPLANNSCNRCIDAIYAFLPFVCRMKVNASIYEWKTRRFQTQGHQVTINSLQFHIRRLSFNNKSHMHAYGHVRVRARPLRETGNLRFNSRGVQDSSSQRAREKSLIHFYNSPRDYRFFPPLPRHNLAVSEKFNRYLRYMILPPLV